MTKEQRLEALTGKLEEVKSELAEIIDEYDNDYAEDEVMDLLVEASSAIEDAIDCTMEASGQ